MTATATHRPQAIRLRRASRTLELTFPGEAPRDLSWEFLRVHSPSAEVRGHGQGQEVLQHGKAKVAINAVNPVGHYAIQLVFDDGHDSGIFSWDYLYDLCHNHDALWQAYLDRLDAAGLSRDPDTQVIQFQP